MNHKKSLTLFLAGLAVAAVGCSMLVGKLSAARTEKADSENDLVKVVKTPETETADVLYGSEGGGENALPVSYDLRDHMDIGTVPDQGQFNTCWAFASLGALRTSMPQSMRTLLSVDHMSLKNGSGVGQTDSGDYIVSTSYLLAWEGPVSGVSDLYGDGVTPDGLTPVCHVQEIRFPEAKDYTKIKQDIMTVGGVQSEIYLPLEKRSQVGLSYYYNGTNEPNHDIVIIGWDDNYPKEKFDPQPERNGAFLCMNSWGESFGDRGCFYVSYEDSRIGTYNLVYSGIERTDNYDKIYQTDICGWKGQMGYGNSTAWFANVYKTDSAESIEAVGFYATTPGTTCEVYVAELDEYGPGVPKVDEILRSARWRKALARATFTDAGYYTVRLESPVELPKDAEFAVIVQIDSPGAEEPVAIEYDSGEAGRTVDISDGEGYISRDGSTWENTEEKEAANICLKAYTKKTSSR